MGGGALWYSIRNSAKLGEKVEQFQAKEKARRELDDFTSKKHKETADKLDCPDKLEPWL